ncbi:transposase [Streptomyces bluensis]|uniref:transposase n=1 Tax=Streptomyces bluensis TaxID=33897 RepID=UPI0019C48746|nr:transposase [Streptomyces bluensis]GGZ40854.1 hypothetical protein GCM10010344_01790 [Streptomyces bluensis]
MSPWLRSGVPCSAERLFCHVYGRAKTASQFIPGWPYSFVAVLEPGATSWTAVLDAVRLGPADDATAITAVQLRGVVERLIAAGLWQTGDPHIVIVSDAGYDVTRLAWVLRDLPVELVGRVRSDCVMRLLKPPLDARRHRSAAKARRGIPLHQAGDPARARDHHGHGHTNYGKAETQAWDRVHPRLTHCSSWLDHGGELPVVEGTLMGLKVEYLLKERDSPPVWLWSLKTGATSDDVDRFWQAFLRRFDLSTPSVSRSRPWAGPLRNSVLPRRRTAVPGS